MADALSKKFAMDVVALDADIAQRTVLYRAAVALSSELAILLLDEVTRSTNPCY
jgi:hypothetical protein